jgi:hypothetical protein
MKKRFLKIPSISTTTTTTSLFSETHLPLQRFLRYVALRWNGFIIILTERCLWKCPTEVFENVILLSCVKVSLNNNMRKIIIIIVEEGLVCRFVGWVRGSYHIYLSGVVAVYYYFSIYYYY